MPKIVEQKKYENKILEELAKGKSLISICKILKISYPTVDKWLAKDPIFSERYARARATQIDYLAEDTLEISDNEKISPDSRRIRVETRKWFASRMNPKKYGDSQTVKQIGDKENPIEIKQIHDIDVTKHFLDVLTLDQLKEIKRRALAESTPK